MPFLLGVLVYQVRGLDRRWGWAVGPAAAACLYATCTRPVTPEQNWTLLGLVAAGTVWLAVVLPQADARNRLARLGDCTYGLFLFHVPLLFAVFYPAARLGWARTVNALAATGATLLVRAAPTGGRGWIGPAGIDGDDIADLLGSRWRASDAAAQTAAAVDWHHYSLVGVS